MFLVEATGDSFHSKDKVQKFKKRIKLKIRKKNKKQKQNINNKKMIIPTNVFELASSRN